MSKPDARLLNPTIQDYLRQQAIRLRQQGKRQSEIATYLGVHRTTVWEWWQAYQQRGAFLGSFATSISKASASTVRK